MLDIRFVRDNADLVARRLGTRGAEVDLGGFLAADARRRDLLQRIETLRAERNRFSAEIAHLKRERQEVAPERFGEMKRIAADIKAIEEDLKGLEDQAGGFLLSVPNLPHESVPVGRSAADNVVVRTWGEKPAFDFTPREHDSIGEELGILDFTRAARIAGARFSLYRGAGAQLERALISFMLDLHTRAHGYTEVLPPFLVSGQSMTGTGQLPKFFDDLFKIEGMDFFLIPTAEVPVTNIHAREVLREEDLPIRYTAYTPCFRREAGSYGKDTRGLIRQHQFNKVELVTYARPEESYAELEALLRNAETVLQRLGLHYRVVELCTGDLGFSAAKTYDIEVWLPGQDAYREISSCSNFDDFQARRMEIRFKRAQSKKNELVHTLNGSGLAVGRTVVALLENCQQRDGSVLVPEALRPYMGGLERICRQTG